MSKARDLASATPVPSAVSATELGYLDGVTSSVQTQITSVSTAASNAATAAANAASDASNALSVANSKTAVVKGTTAQRPTGSQGDLYYDTTLDLLMTKNATSWVPLIPGSTSVEYLVIAGGGGGSGMGGGGAGGFRDGTTTVPLFTPLNVTIGAGAAGAIAGQNCTSRGGNSVFHSITSTGGGSGCSNTVAGVTPDPISDGGSSAGALFNGQIAAPGNAGGYSPVEGYAGGGPNINGWQSGGGGGGAGGAGSWNGGTGKNSSITGTAVTYAGGGGGGKGDQNGNGAAGGAGGGGTGGGWGYNGSSNQPTSGTFYGAGGGGIGYAQGYNGGSGYQGVVILKYDSSKTLNATGFTTSTATSGAFKITTITAGTGTVSFS